MWWKKRTFPLFFICLIMLSLFQISVAVNTNIPTRKWPQNLKDGKGWIGYGIYGGLSIVLPILFIVVLYICAFMFWCCRCIGCCGGGKAHYKGYSQRQVSLSKMIFLFFFINTMLLLALAIVFTVIFSVSIKRMEQDAFAVVDTTALRIDKVVDTVNNTAGVVQEALKPIDDVFTAAKGFETSLNKISGGLDSIALDVDKLEDEVNQITSLLTDLKSALADMTAASDNHIPDHTGDVPDMISTSFISEAQTIIQDAKDKVQEGFDTYNDMFSDMNSQVTNLKTEADKTITDMTSGISTPISSVTGYIDTFKKYYNKVKYYVDIVDAVRLAVFLTIYVLAASVIAMLLVGICINLPASPRVSAFCFFVAPIVFVIVGGLQLVLFIVTTDVCREFEPALKRSQSLIDDLLGSDSGSRRIEPLMLDQRYQKTMSTLGFKQTNEIDITELLNVTIIVDRVFYCKPEDSLLDFFPRLNLPSFNISSYLEPIRHQVDDSLNAFNIDDIVTNQNAYVDDFLEKRDSIDFSSITVKIEDLFPQINDVYANYLNLSLYGYDEQTVAAELEDLNTRSASIGGQYFELDNITLLDPSVPPYSTDDQSYYANKKTGLTQARDLRDTVQDKIDTIKVHLGVANTSLASILLHVNKIETIAKNDTGINQLQSGISSVPTVFNNVVHVINNAFSSFESIVTAKIDEVFALAKCDQFGTFYAKTKVHVCEEMSPSSGIISLSCFLLAAVGLVWFCFTLPLTKRLNSVSKDRSVDRELQERY